MSKHADTFKSPHPIHHTQHNSPSLPQVTLTQHNATSIPTRTPNPRASDYLALRPYYAVLYSTLYPSKQHIILHKLAPPIPSHLIPSHLIPPSRSYPKRIIPPQSSPPHTHTYKLHRTLIPIPTTISITPAIQPHRALTSRHYIYPSTPVVPQAHPSCQPTQFYQVPCLSRSSSDSWY